MSTFNAGPANSGTAPVELTAGKIREMMANAQRAIAQRKVELGLTENGAANGLNFPPGVIPDTETVDKMRRAAQLQAQITARLNSGILSSHTVNSDSR
nr:SJCHGC09789 protein [Schistosoma japonicum]